MNSRRNGSQLVGVLIAISIFALALCAICAFGAGGSPVEPASCTFTNVRGEATASGSSQTYTRGDSLLFTNCVACGSSTGTIQTLTNVTLTIAVGNTDAHTLYTGTVQSAAAGTWWCSATVPTSGTVYVETRIVDENTNSYTYSGWKLLSAQESLH
jgi:hypothetical protein